MVVVGREGARTRVTPLGDPERFGNGNVQAAAAIELRGGAENCRGRGCCLPSQTLPCSQRAARGRLIFCISATESLPPLCARPRIRGLLFPPFSEAFSSTRFACPLPCIPSQACTLPVVGIPSESVSSLLLYCFLLPPSLFPPLPSPPFLFLAAFFFRPPAAKKRRWSLFIRLQLASQVMGPGPGRPPPLSHISDEG